MINRQHFPPDKLEHLKIKEEENQIQRQYPIMHDQRGRGGIDMHELIDTILTYYDRSVRWVCRMKRKMTKINTR